MNRSSVHKGETGDAPCGCRIGGLHRFACASVGHVDPPRAYSCYCPNALGYKFHRYPCPRAGQIDLLTPPGSEADRG